MLRLGVLDTKEAPVEYALRAGSVRNMRQIQARHEKMCPNSLFFGVLAQWAGVDAPTSHDALCDVEISKIRRINLRTSELKSGSLIMSPTAKNTEKTMD